MKSRSRDGLAAKGLLVENRTFLNQSQARKLKFLWLQTELDDTKSYYQLIRKITISEKKKK